MNYVLKKSCYFLLVFLFLFNFNYTFADDIEYINDETSLSENIDTYTSIETSTKDTGTLNLNARSCIVLDRLSKKTLYGKNETSRVKMASTTKIMTAIIIIETCNLNQTIEVSKKAAGTGGSRMGLKSGDKINIKDLLYGLMLCSGNDAAVALAEAAAGSVQNFSDLMNSKAKELGLNNTNFESPHGLDSNNHYTTAYELALLSDYALKNTIFNNIVGTKNYTVTINGYPKNLNNTNELLGNLNGVYGIKTGFTNGANRCLVTACKRKDMDIICVVLGCDTKKFRTTDSIKLIEYTFKNFEYVDISKKIEEEFNKWKLENLNYFNINKGTTNNLKLKYSNLENPIMPINKNDIPSLKIQIYINNNFNAPILEDYILGRIEITSNDILVSCCDILSANTVKRKNIFNYTANFFKNYSYILNTITTAI